MGDEIERQTYHKIEVGKIKVIFYPNPGPRVSNWRFELICTASGGKPWYIPVRYLADAEKAVRLARRWIARRTWFWFWFKLVD